MSNRRLPLRLRLLDPRPAGHGASRSGRSRNARLANRARPARTDNQEDTVDQICSPTEQVAAISAFKNGASINAVASMLGKTPGSVEWLLKKNGLKRLDDLGMMKNDTLGDCTCAAIGHLIQTWTSQTTSEAIIPDAQIVELYEHACGYDPTDPDSDQGGVEIDVLNYWRKNPVDGPNGPHSLDAFAAVARRHHADVKDAVWLFGGAYIGVALPLSAQSQKVWDVPSGGPAGDGAPGSWGGHAVPVIAYDGSGLTCITWGALKRMTWAFWDTYCDEAYACLSRDWAAARAPSGFDWAALDADLGGFQRAA
jgi:hypothetical protein